MTPRAIVHAGSEEAAQQLQASPGLLSGDHIFLTGMTGGRSDRTMPDDLEEQFRNAFEKIGTVLAEVDLDHSAIVERQAITSAFAIISTPSALSSLRLFQNLFQHGQPLR